MSRNIHLSRFDPLASHSGASAPAGQPRPSSDAAVQSQGSQFLEQQGFSSGLIQVLDRYRSAFPLRIWVLDNSSSMNIRDSHRIVGRFDNLQNVPVTRWEELQDCVAYHSHMASLFQLPTRFALLNNPTSAVGPQFFSVADHGPSNSGITIAQDMQTVQQVMTRTLPGGPTPLTAHLTLLRQYIADIAPRLRQAQQTVTVVLATQGLPTDQGFVPALRSFEGLPVWFVVRLCTDDERVFDFYNTLDAQLNLPYDVLDDLFGESLEVYLRNPWLTYALPLHRFRELGFRFDVLDEIDEHPLNRQQVRDLCSLLFAGPLLPDPDRDWNGFFQAVTYLVNREKQQWNPVTRNMCPWINLHHLNHLYGGQQPMGGGVPQSVPFQYGYSPQQQPPPQQQQSPSAQSYRQGFQQPQHQPQTAQPWQSAPPQAQTPRQQPQVPPQSPQGTAPPVTTTSFKQAILAQWALRPPQCQVLRPLYDLLGSLQTTFPPAFGVEQHDYFSKWKPFSLDALASGQDAVLKRATRKVKFFLHPDKLPLDFTEKQSVLCRTLWDVIADAADPDTASTK